jgi:hypothetical protein
MATELRELLSERATRGEVAADQLQAQVLKYRSPGV